MKQFSKLMLVALSFGSLAVAMSLMPSKSVGAPPPGSAPVMVTNTPLPVQGTVGAMQNGSWNVGISGTPSVNISNSASSPVLQRNVDAGTLTHVGQKVSNLVGLFTTSTIFGLSGYQRNLPDGSATSNFTIPAGQALVITDVDWSCGGAVAGTEIFFDLFLTNSPVLLQTQATANSNGSAHASEHLTSGVAVTGQLQHPGAVSVQCGSWEVAVYGYLVPNE
jgi:hypothetical protein